MTRRGRRFRRRGDTVIGAILLTALTVGAGVFILAVATGWLGVSLQSSTSEANRAVLLVKTSAQLNFERVFYTGVVRNVTVRNIADVPITITRIEIVSPSGVLKASYPASGFTRIGEVQPQQAIELDSGVVPACSSCTSFETLRMRIWYVASSLFDDANPMISVDEMRYVESVFVHPPVGAPARCPLPPNWMMVDVVDPVTYTDSGKIPPSPNNRVYVRFPFASSSGTATVDLQVVNATGEYGFATNTVPTISNVLQPFAGSFAGFQVPLTVRVLSADYTILQQEWVFGGIPGKAHASGVTLWSDANKNVNVVEVELGVNDVVGGNYRVTVTLYDCNGAQILSRSITVRIPVGIFTDSVFIDIPSTPLTDIKRVVIGVEEA
ncbi:hypothetical protein HRbin02_00734 [Candidatus Calditenuaceae archaeon HR02]|nr:hypothetical protein HRbin02_00734 [Candidatus Calditenuaceae archaeon HR02]